MPHLEKTDLASVYRSHVLEQLDELALHLERVRWRLTRSLFCAELYGLYRCGPRVEHQFAAQYSQEFEAAEPELIESGKETTLRGLQIRAGHWASCSPCRHTSRTDLISESTLGFWPQAETGPVVFQFGFLAGAPNWTIPSNHRSYLRVRESPLKFAAQLTASRFL